jgi:hypothetical protein
VGGQKIALDFVLAWFLQDEETTKESDPSDEIPTSFFSFQRNSSGQESF